ncbi:hypothetical protein [Litorihabitans aurantiacus]|uniref:hypothetical protein n=1 Tax=Litorihabitans aurantiacus TaxID=1930061 RepID=UPI0032AECCB6
MIAGHRGYIGADARTRLAEAERALTDVHRHGTDDDAREQAFGLARRAAQLASQALDLARRDIDGEHGDEWGWDDGRGRRRGGDGGFGGLGALGGLGGGRRTNDLGGLAGGILGGMVLGGLMDDIFD